MTQESHKSHIGPRYWSSCSAR